jgi:flavin reductase (DIM6/NTAB) family NADH-FMN oxidoreductase RutF
MNSPRRIEIGTGEFLVRAHEIWDQGWFLLTSGDFEARSFNTMTVSWGSFGTIWNRALAQVVVRPTRHTYQFMERHETFTLSAFPEACRPALEILGSRSGRDGDKIAEAGLTPIASTQVASPGFDEAHLIIECRKIYSDDLRPARFVDPTIDEHYPKKDYHRFYFGEIVAVRGTEAFRSIR